MKIIKNIFCLAAVLILLPIVSEAHVGLHDTFGFYNGIAHPLFGVDHLCAMIAVGLWAAQRGGPSLWQLPLGFLFFMAIGGVLGATGFSLPLVETGIVVSLIALGGVIAFSSKGPLSFALGIVAIFAMCHGFAHGAEMPSSAMLVTYGLGFLISTAVIHSIGIAAGLLLQKVAAEKIIRYAGMAIAATGLYLFFV